MMNKILTSSITSMIELVIMLAISFSTLAQGISNPNQPAKDSLQKNQEERERSFLHFDEYYTNREVPNGTKVHKLPQGKLIAAFAKGGEKEAAMNDFLNRQKVAGLLVLQDGKIRLEHYERGLSNTGQWPSFSIAKSVTSTLLGAAIKDGYIKSVDELVTSYIPDLKGSAYDSVTIHQLLTMTTGVQWNENYADPENDVAKFSTAPLEPGIDETVSYMRRLPAVAKPGEKWAYKTGETHLLGVLVSAATGQTLSEYLSKKIWSPYGMEQKASWGLGRTNEELAGCCLQARPRDFARFGQFVLEGGRINGESIAPDGWFKTATSIQVPIWPGGGYGYQWWIFNQNTFEALGIHGQVIHIDPARRLVIVINSAWPEAESMERHAAVANFIDTIAKEVDKEKTE